MSGCDCRGVHKQESEDMTTERKSAAIRVAIPICVLAAGATLALRCSAGRDAASPVEVRQAALTAEASTSWWKIVRSDGLFSGLAPVAAIATAARGTEIFTANHA